MSPDRLINKLEALGSIDQKIIHKLREQVQSSAKPVKATSILKYLVKKELLSQSAAKAVLKSAAADIQRNYSASIKHQSGRSLSTQITSTAPLVRLPVRRMATAMMK